MQQLKLIIAGVAALCFFGANLFLAYDAGNAIYLAPSVAIVSVVILLHDRMMWFGGFLLLAFFDVRGEIATLPIHLWELYLFTAAVPLLVRPGQLRVNKIEGALLVLFAVAVLSAVLNSSYQQGLKSAVRWLEYFIVYRTIRFASAPLASLQPPASLTRTLTIPLLALALFGAVQSTVIKDHWVRILEGRTGALLLGPNESKIRAVKNNFGFSGEHSDAFRAAGLYLSAVDLSAVLMISIAVLYLTGNRSVLTGAAALLAGITLILSMGRASLLYGVVSILFALLIYQRRAQTLLSLCGVLIVLTVGLLAYAPARERLLTLTDTEQNTEEERTLIWKTGLNIWKSSPIYGKGGGSTSSLFDNNAAVDWLEGRQGTTHSTYIGTLAELGVLGLCAWLYFLWTLRKDFADDRHSAETKALLCFCFVFLIMMGVSSDTYTAGNPYFVLVLLVFGWHSQAMAAASLEPRGSAAAIGFLPREGT